MTRLPQLSGALAEELAPHVADVRVVRGNELHCSVHPAAIPALARRFHVQPVASSTD